MSRHSLAISLSAAGLLHLALAQLPITRPGPATERPVLRVQLAAWPDASGPTPPRTQTASVPPTIAPPPERTAAPPRPSASVRPATRRPRSPRPATARPVPEPQPATIAQPVADAAVDRALPASTPIAAIASTTLDALPASPLAPPGSPPADASPVTAHTETDDRRAYAAAVRQRIEARKTYPARARRLGLRGTAEVTVVIRSDGSPARRPTITVSSGSSILDRHAVEMAVRAAPFPTHDSQTPLAIAVPVRFGH
ncbi:MAG: TonB family protein [Myxococcota bacterium]